jgi:RNA polymerase sigma-70 factor (ECF subfamily)
LQAQLIKEDTMDSYTEADGCSPPDEMDLVARIIAGDSGLFHDLVRTYEHGAYLMAFSMLLHPAKAEKVVQEAFISAYRGLESFREDVRFGNWLFRLIVDHAKSRKQLDETTCALSK